MVDKSFEKITYEDSSGNAKGVYEYFNFATSAPYNGGYGANLTVDRKTRKEKVPLIGFRYPLKIEQDKTPSPDTNDQTELTLSIPSNRVDQFGLLFSIVFLTKTWSALKSVIITTYASGVFQDQQIRNIGSITISKNTYQYYFANIASGDDGRTEVRVLLVFTSSKLKDGKMGIKLYEGFSFKGFSSSDYTNADVTSHFTYPHQKEFDKHKFHDAMIGDVLLTGVEQIDGTIVPDDSLKLTTDNLPDILKVFTKVLQEKKFNRSVSLLAVKGSNTTNTLKYKDPTVRSYGFSKDGRNILFSINFTQPLTHGIYTYEFDIVSTLAGGFDVMLYGECGANGYQGTSLYRFWAKDQPNGDLGAKFSFTSQSKQKNARFHRGSGKKVHFSGSFRYSGDSIVNQGKPYSLNIDTSSMLGRTYEFMVQKITLDTATVASILGQSIIFVFKPDGNHTLNLDGESYFSISKNVTA